MGGGDTGGGPARCAKCGWRPVSPAARAAPPPPGAEAIRLAVQPLVQAAEFTRRKSM
ncbi:hypothetical protein [Frankia sp. EI5c]|uniref:hypothetical protein n=1 Tax=Frankia sp. EI5c TaxID=683316 RepID=UPI0012FF9CCD|nr:hypothetical protein [Frankia sp. EI5c]